MLKKTIGENYNVDPDDVLISKNILNRLGYYKLPEWGLSDTPDKEFFSGIRSCQKDNHLKVDGIMKPFGETIEKASQIFSKRLAYFFGKKDKDEPDDTDCDYQYWEVDIPICRDIQYRLGKTASARCYHSATERYAMCLRGRPIDDLPPLDESE